MKKKQKRNEKIKKPSFEGDTAVSTPTALPKKKKKKTQLERANELLQDSLLANIDRPSIKYNSYNNDNFVINDLEEPTDELKQILDDPAHSFMRVHFPCMYNEENLKKHITDLKLHRVNKRDQIYIKHDTLNKPIFLNQLIEPQQTEPYAFKKVWSNEKNGNPVSDSKCI